MEFKPSEFREEAEQDDKEDVGEVKSDKLNKNLKKTVFFVDNTFLLTLHFGQYYFLHDITFWLTLSFG